MANLLKNRFLFLHIPKAGGSTLLSTIEHQYSSKNMFVDYRLDYKWKQRLAYNLEQIGVRDQKKINIIVGHFGFGCHEYMPFPVNYFTMLREPVSRVVSGYHHLSREQRHPLFSKINNMSLNDYIESGIWYDADNGQVRRLCGLENEYETVEFGECNQEMLELAVKNLNSFCAVGIMDRFDDSLALFQKVLGWKNCVSYVQKNRAPERQRKNQIEEKNIELIKELNKYDIKLYEHATNLMEEMLIRNSININNILAPNIKKTWTSNRILREISPWYRQKKRAVLYRIRNCITPY